jgi:hypothetical protein
MAITKDKKASILEELRGIVKSSLSLVLVNFKGLTVSDTIAMRRALKEKGVGYRTIWVRQGKFANELSINPIEQAMFTVKNITDIQIIISKYEK